jgi:threonine dehydrogenase-like Zn-dependent dehydrogenase
VPDHVPAKLASLALPLGNGVEWTYLQGGVKLGEVVVIQGRPAGPRLHGCRQGGRRRRDHRQRIGMDAPRLALAKQLGATHTVNVEGTICATPCATSPAATWPIW